MIVSILANSANPDKMPHYVAFHLGFHCLPKHPSMGFQYTKGLNMHVQLYSETRGLIVGMNHHQ